MGFRIGCKLCCDNHNRACCISKLSFKSDANLQIEITGKQVSSTSQFRSFKNLDPNILTELFGKIYSGCYNDSESIVESKAIPGELRRLGTITCAENNKFLANCFDK